MRKNELHIGKKVIVDDKKVVVTHLPRLGQTFFFADVFDEKGEFLQNTVFNLEDIKHED